ncbi:unnamed protein product [Arctia plantaginis]|uniref:Tetraspanin n=1 Tax=Arctia plantaginis TaxID=874455 RepID=A0A8S0ZMY2_ARCPL|nr:unnamed protein product [Arctia plantaginis]
MVNGGSTDVLLIFEEIPAGDNMGQTEKLNAIATATRTPETCSAPEKEIVVAEKVVEVIVEGKEDLKLDENDHKTRIVKCLKILFIMLGVAAVILAIALIIVTILTCIATKAYDADQSGRIVAMVLLAVTAALTICVVIYMQVATLRCQSTRMTMACGGLVILIIIQILIGGVSVNVQPSDEAKLLKALTDSFKLAKEDVPRPYKLWAMTQFDLDCCGLFGPDDYRTQKQPYYFPPDVPISCCPNYDPNRSDFVQEKERMHCKTKKIYYKDGCKDEVLLVFSETATLVLTVNVALIIAKILLVILAFALAKQMKTIDFLVCHK